MEELKIKKELFEIKKRLAIAERELQFLRQLEDERYAGWEWEQQKQSAVRDWIKEVSEKLNISTPTMG